MASTSTLSPAMEMAFRGITALLDELRTELRAELRAELKAELAAQLPEWVDEHEAQRLTCLSSTTLWRERKNPRSLIVWKSDHGVRYQRASLLAHNHSRAIGRGYLARPFAA